MAHGLSQKQIQLDSSLLQNSERWIAKKQKGKPRMFYEFGPFRIIESRKTDTTKKEKNHFFELPPLIGKSEISIWKKNYQIKSAFDNDTAYTILSIRMSTSKHTPGIFSKKDETTESHADSIFAISKISNDTAGWILHAGSFGMNQNIEGRLTHNDEEYFIQSEDRFENKNKGQLGPFPKGVVIKNIQGEEIGAIQLRKKYYTWIRKDLPPQLKFAIAISLSLVVANLEQIGDNL